MTNINKNIQRISLYVDATQEDYAPLIKNRQLWSARIDELEELSNEKPESRSYI